MTSPALADAVELGLNMQQKTLFALNGAGTAPSEVAKARSQFITVLTIVLGFLAGAAAGAIAFATIGLRGTLAPVIIVATLALWAAARGQRLT